jgi:hypothetical protein
LLSLALIVFIVLAEFCKEHRLILLCWFYALMRLLALDSNRKYSPSGCLEQEVKHALSLAGRSLAQGLFPW